MPCPRRALSSDGELAASSTIPLRLGNRSLCPFMGLFGDMRIVQDHSCAFPVIFCPGTATDDC